MPTVAPAIMTTEYEQYYGVIWHGCLVGDEQIAAAMLPGALW